MSDASAAEHHTSNPDEAEKPKPKWQKRTPGKQSKHFKECAVVVFKGNGSSKRDSTVDGEWLEDLYGAAELFPGRVVQLPWRKTNWKVVVSRIPCKKDFSVYSVSLVVWSIINVSMGSHLVCAYFLTIDPFLSGVWGLTTPIFVPRKSRNTRSSRARNDLKA